MKLPPLWAIAVVGLFCVAFYFGVSETVRQQQDVRSLELERGKLRVLAHVCAPWKGDSARFSDCANAFEAYEQCEGARLHALERVDTVSGTEVYCEHPVYKFHEREQEELERIKRSVEQKQKQGSDVKTLQK
jgi:hypothetical protein